MSEESSERPRRPRWRPPSLFWPAVLIGVGIALLLTNLGYLSWSSWNVLWRLWPVGLVSLGVEILIGRRSTIGAIISSVLILALVGGAIALAVYAPSIPAFDSLTQPGEWRTEHIEHPLSETKSASVDIDLGSVPYSVGALNDSDNLIEGDITHRGRLIFDVTERGSAAEVKLDSIYNGPWDWPYGFSQPEGGWDVQLSPDVLLKLRIDSGSGRGDLDLSQLQIDDLYIDSGSGDIDLSLPSDSSFTGTIDAGSGRLAINLPTGVGMRVRLDSGSGAFRPNEDFELVSGDRDDGVWETEGFDSAEVAIELKIDQGSGSITIDK
jgi:hypothetical protein